MPQPIIAPADPRMPHLVGLPVSDALLAPELATTCHVTEKPCAPQWNLPPGHDGYLWLSMVIYGWLPVYICFTNVLHGMMLNLSYTMLGASKVRGKPCIWRYLVLWNWNWLGPECLSLILTQQKGCLPNFFTIGNKPRCPRHFPYAPRPENEAKTPHRDWRNAPWCRVLILLSWSICLCPEPHDHFLLNRSPMMPMGCPQRWSPHWPNPLGTQNPSAKHGVLIA